MRLKSMNQIETNDITKRKIRFYLTYVTIMGVLIMIVSFLLKTCKQNKDLVNQVQFKEQAFKKYKDKSGRTIATQEQRILEMSKENMELIKTINKFKSVSSQVGIQTITEYKEIKVPYKEEVVKYVDTWTKDVYVRLPLSCEVKDSFIHLVGSVGVDGLEIDTLRIPNEFTITTGKKKGGLFKKDEYIIEVVSTNPHTDITKLNNTQFKPKRPLYKRWYFGFGLGFLLSTILIK